jgi:hypothetical protein
MKSAKQATGHENSTQPDRPKDPRALTVDRRSGETDADALAHLALRPTFHAAITVREYTQGTFGEISINALVDDLGKQCVQASSGDLQRADATLTAQAHTLDAIFNHLARRAQSAEYLAQMETYLRLGLKAQSQCRATLEALAAIKNPAPVAFVRQANIAQGPQQINNAPAFGEEASRARESGNRPNELLEAKHGSDWLDSRAANPTQASDTPVDGGSRGSDQRAPEQKPVRPGAPVTDSLGL